MQRRAKTINCLLNLHVHVYILYFRNEKFLRVEDPTLFSGRPHILPGLLGHMESCPSPLIITRSIFLSYNVIPASSPCRCDTSAHAQPVVRPFGVIGGVGVGRVWGEVTKAPL